jgi:hypothetical protein
LKADPQLGSDIELVLGSSYGTATAASGSSSSGLAGSETAATATCSA